MSKKRDSSKPMKPTMVLTPESSVKSSTTATSNSTTNTTIEESETKDSYSYFPGCRKDANCNCEICIASFNATLDLMPLTNNRSSLSKPPPRTPVPFNPSILSTPESTTTSKSLTISPSLHSTARISFNQKVKSKKINSGFGYMITKLILCLTLVFGLEFVVSRMVFEILHPKLSVTIVRNLGEKSRSFKNINDGIDFLKKEIQFFIHKDLTSCNSMWKIKQDGMLLHSKCVLYKSITEEVSIWGWPLQTAGLLSSDFSSRSFTILSGRVTEWCNGESSYIIRKNNSSWTQEKWSGSAVQLDPKTWILEYRQSSIIENARVTSVVLDLLKFRLNREFQKVKQQVLMLISGIRNQSMELKGRNFKIPT